MTYRPTHSAHRRSPRDYTARHRCGTLHPLEVLSTDYRRAISCAATYCRGDIDALADYTRLSPLQTYTARH